MLVWDRATCKWHLALVKCLDLVLCALRLRPSANSLTSLEGEREVNLLNVHFGGWNTDDKNNVCTCSGAMEPGDAMFSELNTSDFFFSISTCSLAELPIKLLLGSFPSAWM